MKCTHAATHTHTCLNTFMLLINTTAISPSFVFHCKNVMICQCNLFPPLQALIITKTNHPPGDFFFCQKQQIQRLLLVFLETFVVFGDSKARITLQLGLLFSTSSGCCREPLSRPKTLTGGQSLSSLAQQSEQRGDTHPSASRLQMNRTCA